MGRPPSPDPMSSTLMTRVTPVMLRRVEHAARTAGATTSQWVRQVLADALEAAPDGEGR